MSLNATFDTVLSRVRLAATALDDGTTALFERSADNLVWSTVRGGTAVTITPGDTAALDDYEFTPNALNHYRVTAGSDVFTTTITPAQTDIWLKVPAKPYLNRAVTVVAHSDIRRAARRGIFPVIGRTYPVAITDVRQARDWQFTIRTDTPVEADAVELAFAAGDVFYLQVPATGVYSTIPGGYIAAGDIARQRFGVESPRRWILVEATEVAAPGPDVYGLPATWATIMAEFGSWTAVQTAFPTWAAVKAHISDPSVVIVP